MLKEYFQLFLGGGLLLVLPQSLSKFLHFFTQCDDLLQLSTFKANFNSGHFNTQSIIWLRGPSIIFYGGKCCCETNLQQIKILLTFC